MDPEIKLVILVLTAIIMIMAFMLICAYWFAFLQTLNYQRELAILQSEIGRCNDSCPWCAL